MKFQTLTGVRDAELQRGLAKVKDGVIAASLQGAPRDVSAHILRNLSERRRKALLSLKGPWPLRSRAVAREEILKAVLGPVRSFVEKLAQSHPAFVEARRARTEVLIAEHLLRIVRES